MGKKEKKVYPVSETILPGFRFWEKREKVKKLPDFRVQVTRFTSTVLPVSTTFGKSVTVIYVNPRE